MSNLIIYYRISTKGQQVSGLGLEAQRTAVNNYLQQQDIKELPPSYTEIESGCNSNRPELRKAINMCKATKSILLIAKLDRLARNIKFIFTLKEELEQAGIEFKALDIPEANTLTLGIMATFAQHEAERISQRTKDGLNEARKRGVKLGSPQNLTAEARKKAILSIRKKAKEDVYSTHAFHFIKPRRTSGLSYHKISRLLNEEGYRTRRGSEFSAMQVKRIYDRYAEKI